MLLPKVLVTTRLPGEALSVLEQHAQVEVTDSVDPMAPPELERRLKDCDAVVCVLAERINEPLLASNPRLKLIANVAVGYDNIDVAAASRAGVLVVNTPGVLDETTADLAFALLMSCARRVVESDRYIREGHWNTWRFDFMLGLDVHHKTLGIVGYGRIGQALARRARGFGMKVLYTRKHRGNGSVEAALDQQVDPDELLRSSDFISINCPLNEETYHLIGEKELKLVKPSCILINTARGAILDQMALVDALQKGNLAGAGLDVFEDEPQVPVELVNMKQVVLTPHIGSATVETRSAMASLAVSGLISAFTGDRPHNLVNPEVWDQFSAKSQSFFP